MILAQSGKREENVSGVEVPKIRSSGALLFPIAHADHGERKTP
jgi:hypothetical protein